MTEAEMRRKMKNNRLAVSYQGSHCYDIVLEHHFGGLVEELDQLEFAGRKLCIVTDSKVGFLYAKELASILEMVSSSVVIFEFQAGEENKNLDVVRELYHFLIESNFDRKDGLVALGGGVVGDLTGFAAATYLRGIRFIQVPTTLLAMSDSSIGGKTGVDFEHYKNMVGAFYMPKLVYMNVSALNSLDTKQYCSGFGEVIKHGLIRDAAFYHWLTEQREGILQRTPDLLEQMIRKNCEIKREVVQADPMEQGERAILNFGHTIGHAVEKRMNFAWLHGECVGVGMIAAAYLSMCRGRITENELNELMALTKAYHLPVSLSNSNLTAEEILETAEKDKKKDGSKIKFILLDEIGHARIDTSVSKEEMTKAIQFLLGERSL